MASFHRQISQAPCFPMHQLCSHLCTAKLSICALGHIPSHRPRTLPLRPFRFPHHQFSPKYGILPNSIQICYNVSYVFKRSLHWPHVSLQRLHFSPHIERKIPWPISLLHSLRSSSLFNPLWADSLPPLSPESATNPVLPGPEPVPGSNLCSALLPCGSFGPRDFVGSCPDLTNK